MKKRILSQSCSQAWRSLALSLLSSMLVLPQALRADAAPSGDATEYEKAARLPSLSQPLEFTQDGRVKIDKKTWKLDKDVDGTEIYTALKGDETKAAALVGKNGRLEAFISYRLVPGKENVTEKASGLFFTDNKLTAFTSCEDTREMKEIGRVCITATPQLCRDLKKGQTIEPETVKELDLFEMRALASILTLRGPDHQLENTVRFGNRLGLKSGLQTTKGQLIALARQIAKESGKAEKREPADKTSTEGGDAIAEKMKLDSRLAKTVLEKNLPRLKDVCASF